MAKTIRPEWLNTQLRNTLRSEENDGKMIEMNHSTSEQNGRKNQ